MGRKLSFEREYTERSSHSTATHAPLLERGGHQHDAQGDQYAAADRQARLKNDKPA